MDTLKSSKIIALSLMLLLLLAGCIAPPPGQTAEAAADNTEAATEANAEATEEVTEEATEEATEEMDHEMDEESETEPVGELPSGPTLVLRHDMAINDAPADFTVLQRVLEFAPDAWAPPHFHGGHVMVTVLEGEFTNRMGENLEDITVFMPGESFQEPPGQVHSPGNATEDIVRVFASFAMPADAAITTVVDGMIEGELPPGPSQIYVGTMEVTDVPAEFTFIQVILDFAPGAWTPTHLHGGNGLTTVISGEMTRRINGVEETYGPGESWYEVEGEPHAAGNLTDETSRIIVTFVLPEGAELTTALD